MGQSVVVNTNTVGNGRGRGQLQSCFYSGKHAGAISIEKAKGRIRTRPLERLEPSGTLEPD